MTGGAGPHAHESLVTLREMEHEHREALRRIYQADEMWRKNGHTSMTFQLWYTGAGPGINHPCWDPSWGVLSEHAIDDLGDDGILRIEPVAPSTKNRTFSLTAKGRREGAAIVEQATLPIVIGGQAPAPDEVLAWLLRVAADAPECLERPRLLLDRAVAENLIAITGRERLAARVLGLVTDGYLRGNLLDVDQANAEQTLCGSSDLELTMKTYTTTPSEPAPSVSLAIFGPVVNSQVAMGDITTFTTFVEVLDRAYAEIDSLTDVDDETKAGAKGLLDRLRGKPAHALTTVATSAASALVAQLLARLVGMPLS